MRFCGTGIAPSRGCAFTARRVARCGRTSSRSSSRRCSRWPARPFRSSPRASGRSTPTGTSKWPALSIRCRWPCWACGSACAGMRSWCASSTCDTLVVGARRVAAGVFAPRAGEAEASTRQQAFVDRLVGQCERVGPALQQWAEAALAARGRPRHSPDSGRAGPDAPPSARARPGGASPRHTPTSTFGIKPFDSSWSARRPRPGRRSSPTIRRFAR